MQRQTPMKLPPLIVGENVVVEVKREGYVPARYELKIAVDTATVTRAVLSKARVMDVVSDPEGAKVTVDGTVRGRTPLYGLEVPGGKRFEIRIEKAGFFGHKKRMRMGKGDERVDVRLKERPLRKMPLTKEERSRLRKVDQQIARAKRTFAKKKKRFQQAQRLRNRIDNTVDATIHERAKVETAFDVAKDAMDDAKEEVTVLSEEIENLKSEVLGRLEEESLVNEAGLP